MIKLLNQYVSTNSEVKRRCIERLLDMLYPAKELKRELH